MAAKLLSLIAFFSSTAAFAWGDNCNHYHSCYKCMLPQTAVTSVTNPFAAKLLERLKIAVAKKLPGAQASLGTPKLLDLSDARGYGAVYPALITAKGQTFTVATDREPGLYEPAEVRDTGYFHRCSVTGADFTARGYDGYAVVSVLDAKGHAVVTMAFGEKPAPPEPFDPNQRGPGVCLTQCPPDDITGLPGQCDPSLLCNPGL